MAEKFANDFATTLTAGISAGDVSIPVAAAAPAALQGGQFRVKVDNEILLITATGGSGASPWTAARGAEGSTAATHSSGAAVTHVLTAVVLTDHETRLGALQRAGADRFRAGRIFSTRFIADTSKSVTGVAATGVFTATAHGYLAGELVYFSALTGGSGLAVGTPYYVVAANLAANTFSVATTPGGSVLTFASDVTAGTVKRIGDAAWYSLSNFSFLPDPASARPSIRATDGGTATPATLLTAVRDLRNVTIRVRYRPAKDATTSSTDYGLGVTARKLNETNKWDVLQNHAAASANTQLTSVCEGASTALVITGSPKATTGVAATGIFTSTAHGLLAGDVVIFNALVGGSGITPGTRYYVVQTNLAANTFSVATTEGGSVLTFSSDVTSGTARGDVPIATRNVTGVAATDIFTSTAHGLVAGDRVVFSGMTGGAGITAGTVYYVIAANLAANTFQVSTTSGGAALNFTTDLTAGSVSYVNGISLDQDRILKVEITDDLYCMKSWQADQVEPDWQHVTRCRSPQLSASQDNSDWGACGIGGGGLFMGSYILELSVVELIRNEPSNMLRNTDFRLKDRATASLTVERPPAFWVPGAASGSGNSNSVVSMADDLGFTRKALKLVVGSVGDATLNWTQYLYSPVAIGSAAVGARMRRHPMLDTVTGFIEFSFMSKGVVTNAMTTIGIVWDLYYYDALNNALNSGDPTYFPTIIPAGNPSSWEWTKFSYRINVVNYERLMYVRAQFLPHDATGTGTFYIMDPKLTPVA